ncbi:MAG: winged helix-turn-helix domain-containing protein, partial [Cellulomonas sp.]
DDYMTKPFSSRVLVARIRTMMRRPRGDASQSDGAGSPEAAPLRRFGELGIDPEAREVWLGERLVPLTPIEFDLLSTLSSRPGIAFSRARLVEQVWGPGWFGNDRLVDIHLGHVRRKLGDAPGAPRYVRTVRGVGYRMGTG